MAGVWVRRRAGRSVDARGPSAVAPGGYFWSIRGNTDSRQWFSVQTNFERSANDEGGWSNKANLTVSIKPSSTVTISTGPEWKRSRGEAEVTTVDDITAVATHGQRYVFGTIDQTEISMTTRLNLILTPTVSIQVFAQPLLASGDYVDFRELARPRTFDFVHGQRRTPLDFDAFANSYSVDPDGSLGAASSFSFDNPDFNLKSLKLNAVFRWEIKSGSNFYAVWTRQQEDERDPGHFVFGRDTGRCSERRVTTSFS